MDQTQTERLLKCLESIADSLMKLANPPKEESADFADSGWMWLYQNDLLFWGSPSSPPSPKAPVDMNYESTTGEEKKQSPWLFRFLTGKT